jgi:negative regulator of flagellin synthesis FlgM
MAAQGAPVDVARVARVKQAIASGNYPVDPDKIAEKMLDLDLPTTRN